MSERTSYMRERYGGVCMQSSTIKRTGSLLCCKSIHTFTDTDLRQRVKSQPLIVIQQHHSGIKLPRYTLLHSELL